MPQGNLPNLYCHCLHCHLCCHLPVSCRVIVGHHPPTQVIQRSSLMVRVPYLRVNARNRFTNNDLTSRPFCCASTIPGVHSWSPLERMQRRCVSSAGRSAMQQINPLTCLSGDVVSCPWAKGWVLSPFEIADEAEAGSQREVLLRRDVGACCCCLPSLACCCGCLGLCHDSDQEERWPLEQGWAGLYNFVKLHPSPIRGNSHLGASGWWCSPMRGAAAGHQWSLQVMDCAALLLWLTACRHSWHFSYLTTNTQIIRWSWKTAKTSERLIVCQIVFSIQIELNGSWKQLCIKLQQI